MQPGDNLWAIADAQEIPGGWTGLYETNKGLLGSDPDLILPGQNLDWGWTRARTGVRTRARTGSRRRAPRRPPPTDRIRENTPKIEAVKRPMSTFA